MNLEGTDLDNVPDFDVGDLITGEDGIMYREIEVREQDRFLPVANIARIMKKVLPSNAKIAKDGKETIQNCVSEFISFITSEASEKCQTEKRKTINGDDILWAMSTLGMDKYIDPLRTYLLKYRESVKGERPEKKTSKRDLHAMNLHTSSSSSYQQQKAMKSYNSSTSGSQMSLQIPSQMPMAPSLSNNDNLQPLSYQQPGEVPFSTVPPVLDQAQMSNYMAQDMSMSMSSSPYSNTLMTQSSSQQHVNSQQYVYDPNANVLQSGTPLNTTNAAPVSVPVMPVAPPQQSFYPPPQNPQPPPVPQLLVPVVQQMAVPQVQEQPLQVPTQQQLQQQPQQQQQQQQSQQQEIQSLPTDASIKKE